MEEGFRDSFSLLCDKIVLDPMKIGKIWHFFSFFVLLLSFLMPLSSCGRENSLQESVSVEKPISYRYMSRQFPVERDGMNIYGELFTPEGEGTFPTVILSHGFNVTGEVNRQYAISLVKHGYVSYLFDFCGGSPDSRSDGDMLNMSVLTEAKDLEAVIDAIKELPQVDTSHLFLCGESQGGFVSTYVACQKAEEIKGLVNFYPAYSLQEAARWRRDHKDEITNPNVVLGVKVGDIYDEDILSFDIYEEMKKYQNDVLIVHGTWDTTVKISYSEKALDYFPHATLIPIEKARHGFGDEKDHALAEEYLLDFIARESSEA